jgi:2-phospho-L-lactate guanylyltransferase (CobY/MobA/RfbA family)
VPFRGADAKRRLSSLPPAERRSLAHAMLADVLTAAATVGRTILVTPEKAVQARALAELAGAEVVDDPGRGQGEAVLQALRTLDDGPVLVVNADVPCVQPADLLALLGHLPAGGLTLVEASDGTTNALALASPRLSRSSTAGGARRVSAATPRGSAFRGRTRRSPRLRTTSTVSPISKRSRGGSVP